MQTPQRKRPLPRPERKGEPRRTPASALESHTWTQRAPHAAVGVGKEGIVSLGQTWQTQMELWTRIGHCCLSQTQSLWSLEESPAWHPQPLKRAGLIFLPGGDTKHPDCAGGQRPGTPLSMPAIRVIVTCCVTSVLGLAPAPLHCTSGNRKPPPHPSPHHRGFSWAHLDPPAAFHPSLAGL